MTPAPGIKIEDDRLMPKTRRTSVEARPENPVSGAEDRPWLGSHLSIAGGMYHALDAVTTLQCECVQVFTKNQRQWKSKPLSDEDIAAWKLTSLSVFICSLSKTHNFRTAPKRGKR